MANQYDSVLKICFKKSICIPQNLKRIHVHCNCEIYKGVFQLVDLNQTLISIFVT